MSALHPTNYRFRQYRGDRLIWANGVGELDGSIRRGTPAEAEVIAAQDWLPNGLADEGEQSILDVYFRGGTAPSGFYLRLYDDTPAEDDTLETLTGEVTGSGYSAIAVARNSTDFPTLALDSGDYKVTSATKTFTATGTWSDATQLVLATTSNDTGLLIAYVALSTTRTLVNGDSLAVDLSVKLS